MKRWFTKNINNPYANSKYKKILAQKANLTEEQVANWLRHERRTISNRKLSFDKTIILNEFYEQKNKKPIKKDIEKLAKKLGISAFKINCWFTHKRFREKKFYLMNK